METNQNNGTTTIPYYLIRIVVGVELRTRGPVCGARCFELFKFHPCVLKLCPHRYDDIRRLKELPDATLVDFVNDAAAECVEHPVTVTEPRSEVTFFVVELLDAIARKRLGARVAKAVSVPTERASRNQRTSTQGQGLRVVPESESKA